MDFRCKLLSVLRFGAEEKLLITLGLATSKLGTIHDNKDNIKGSALAATP
jgi:hypothetical protein